MTQSLPGWIHLQGVRVEGVRIGVYPHERQQPRHLMLDIGVLAEIGSASASDNLASGIDYDAIGRVAAEICLSRHHNLIECLADRIAVTILEHFDVQRVTVQVYKPGVLRGATASVRIERSR